MSGLLANTL